jgi:hypothetical protein
MTNTTLTIFKVMHVIFWVLFIGLCFKTVAILISFLVSLFIGSDSAKIVPFGIEPFDLPASGRWYYMLIISFMIAITALKAYIAYLVVRIFSNFNFSRPFSREITSLISKISYVALETGVIALIANGYSEWLVKRHVTVPVNWGSGEILFFAGVIYIIAIVFERGTELQTESDLTV